MDIGFVARVFAGLALSLATSFLPAAAARDDGARYVDRVAIANQLLPVMGTPAAPVTFQVTPSGALLLDQALFARIDGIDPTNSAFIEGRFAEQGGGTIAMVNIADARNQIGLSLPQPGRPTAVLATLALGLFFFLRRIV